MLHFSSPARRRPQRRTSGPRVPSRFRLRHPAKGTRMTPAAYSARLSRIADELQAAIDARPELRSRDTGPQLTHSFLVRVGQILADAAAAGLVELPSCAADVRPSDRVVDDADLRAHLERTRVEHRHYRIALAALQDRAAWRQASVSDSCTADGAPSGMDLYARAAPQGRSLSDRPIHRR